MLTVIFRQCIAVVGRKIWLLVIIYNLELIYTSRQIDIQLYIWANSDFILN